MNAYNKSHNHGACIIVGKAGVGNTNGTNQYGLTTDINMHHNRMVLDKICTLRVLSAIISKISIHSFLKFITPIVVLLNEMTAWFHSRCQTWRVNKAKIK